MINSCFCVFLALIFLLTSWFWVPLLLLTFPIWALLLVLIYLSLKLFGFWGRFMRLLYEAYDWLVFKSDKPRKYIWHRFYDFLCWYFPNENWRTLNYGFAVDSETGKTIELDHFYESERFRYQLYYFIGTGFNTIENYASKHVIDIGCGRGGGLHFVKKHLRPASALGIDISRKHVNFCKKYYKEEGLNFSWGDAESLPIKSESVDYVLCVESSHCFGNFRNFFIEVKRILKPNGHFFLCDFFSTADREEYEENFAGLKLVEKKEITENVLISLKLDSKRKNEIIDKEAPFLLRRGLRRFVGIEGSTIYNQLEAGDTVYMAYHFINAETDD